MKIFTDIKNFIKNSDEFTKNKPKTVLCYSTTLKVSSVILMILNTLYPLHLLISSLILFSASLYCDHKILSNIDDLIFFAFQKNIKNNPYKSGYYLGRITASIFKAGFFEKAKGFYQGFKSELFF